MVINSAGGASHHKFGPDGEPWPFNELLPAAVMRMITNHRKVVRNKNGEVSPQESQVGGFYKVTKCRGPDGTVSYFVEDTLSGQVCPDPAFPFAAK